MTAQPTEIEKTFNKLSKAIEKANRAMREFKESVKNGICHHPENYQYYYDKDCDDGYGRWWKLKCKTCRICGQNFHSYHENDWRKSEG